VLEQHSALLPHIAIPAEAVNEALVAGFGWVMVYGAASAFLLAAISFFIFSPGRSVQRNPEMPQNT
jgi:hypothetical protein